MATRQLDTKIDREKDFPLSFPQERLWYNLQESFSPLIFNMSSSFKFLGEPNIPAMKKSIHRIVSRHQMLRATIHQDLNSGQLFQRISEPSLETISIHIIDFRKRSSNEYLEYLRMNLLKPFNLSIGPLCQFHIILLKSELTVVQFVVHHIVADGSGIHACELELRSAYAEFRKGDSDRIFPPIKFQYTDFVHWEKNEQDFSKDVEFWKSYLSGMQAISLPKDVAGEIPSIGYPAQQYNFNWPQSLSVSLTTFAEEMNVTPFVVILSGIKMVVKCYTGERDIPILITKHGRIHPQVRNMVGHFINILIVKTDLSVPKSFKELVENVNCNLSSVYEHQAYPFTHVLKDFQKQSSVKPIFPLALTMSPKINKGKDGQPTDYFEVVNGKLTREFTIQLQERENDITGFVRYNPLIYKEKRIQQMMEDWKYLMESGIKLPHLNLDSLNVSSPKM